MLSRRKESAPCAGAPGSPAAAWVSSTAKAAHASAAAAEVIALLNRGEVTISPTTAFVLEELCSGCRTCVDLCPYTAISFIVEEDGHGHARVNDALCKGCGTCAAACPAKAIVARHFTDAQIIAQIEGLFRARKIAQVMGG